jgi:hypothetical protein
MNNDYVLYKDMSSNTIMRRRMIIPMQLRDKVTSHQSALTLMSVKLELRHVMPLPFATTPQGVIAVSVNPDFQAMDIRAPVRSYSIHIFEFELNLRPF